MPTVRNVDVIDQSKKFKVRRMNNNNNNNAHGSVVG